MKTTITLFLCLLLACSFFLLKRSLQEASTPDEGAAGATVVPGDPEGDESFAQGEEAAKPRSEAPAIRSEPLSAGEAGSLGETIERLKRMLREENFEEIDTVMAALASLLEDPELFLEAMEHFREETDPNTLAYLARALSPFVPAAGREVEARVLDMVREDSLSSRRAAALSMLSSIGDPAPGTVTAVAEVSRLDESTSVRLNAIYTMGHWADNPVWWREVSHELIQTIDASEEPVVRGNAIQVIALRGAGLDDVALAAMADYLENDPTPKNRGIAALALGDAPEEIRPIALGHLRNAFGSEKDLDIRRNILTQIARSGEETAVPILLDLELDDPLLEQDVIDYLEILQSADGDPGDVYFQKFALDSERDTVVGTPADHSLDEE